MMKEAQPVEQSPKKEVVKSPQKQQSEEDETYLDKYNMFIPNSKRPEQKMQSPEKNYPPVEVNEMIEIQSEGNDKNSSLEVEEINAEQVHQTLEQSKPKESQTGQLEASDLTSMNQSPEEMILKIKALEA